LSRLSSDSLRSPRRPLAHALGLAALGCLAHAACGEPGPTVGLDSTFTRAEYLLEWATTSATAAGSGPVRLTNDLGFEIALERALLSTYAASLGECAPNAGMALLDALGPTVARAGHGEAADPSTAAGVVETIGDSSVVGLGPVSFAAKRYCRAHWVSAPADLSTARVEETGMAGAAMVLEGRWQQAGDAGTFAWRSELASGALADFPALEGAHARVRIVRSLDTLLDGVDFRTATQASASRAVLLNLAQQTRLDVRAE
jgi:hypothetical protein